MVQIGSHLSVAGGYYKAVECAAKEGCDCVQIFTKNNNQWKARPLTLEDVTLFTSSLREHGIQAPVSHASYLINLASPDDLLWHKSVDAMIVELQRAAMMGIPHVIVHPGAYTTSSEEEGIARVITGIGEVIKRTAELPTTILLENTAGQGSCLGCDFGHLQEMLDGVSSVDRLGVCIDTCHAFAAGYDIRDRAGFDDFCRKIDSQIGFNRVRAVHLNDSKKGLGSRVDRHEHIGEGEIGLDAFRMVLNHPQFSRIPMYLETEKGERDGVSLDIINLAVLRGLIDK